MLSFFKSLSESYKNLTEKVEYFSSTYGATFIIVMLAGYLPMTLLFGGSKMTSLMYLYLFLLTCFAVYVVILCHNYPSIKAFFDTLQALLGGLLMLVFAGLLAYALYESVNFDFLKGRMLQWNAERMLLADTKAPDEIRVQRVVTTDLTNSIVCFSAEHIAGLTGKKTTGIYSVSVEDKLVTKITEEWVYSRVCRDLGSPTPQPAQQNAPQTGQKESRP